MSLTLGEKLRQAREERGFSISEVAEQTRISSLYLQSIENDNYKILPGGIFNKGFVKSFAKFVGLNEQEALDDYSLLISQKEGGNGDDLKVFRPEVLTDDRSTASMAPTIIIAAIILALMTVGVLFLVDYVRQPSENPIANIPVANTKTAAEATPQSAQTEASVSPKMNELKIEFTALSEPVSLLVTTDGKMSSATVSPGTSVSFEPKQNLKLSYSRSLANVVQLSINGKKIALPAQPILPRRNAIEFEINEENLGRIWNTGSILPEPTGSEVMTNANTIAANTGTVAPVSMPARPAAPLRVRPAPASNVNSDASKSLPRPEGTIRTESTPGPGSSPKP